MALILKLEGSKKGLQFLLLSLFILKLGVISILEAEPLSHRAVYQEYRYDALGRLTYVIDGKTKETLERYDYDGVGNLLLKELKGERYIYTYDAAHQLQSMEGPDGLHTYDYDQAGRLIRENLNGAEVVRYTYGYLDKVIAVERDGAITRYSYDGEGNLATKIYPDGRHENYAWSGMQLIMRGDELYINEPHLSGGLPIISKTAEGVRYHLYDELGTSTHDLDLNGTIVKTYENTVYGEGDTQHSPSARFTGKPYDVELGAYIFPFRNYDPITVRWRSTDPIGFPDGPNNHFYAAVPTMQIDPWGLAVFDSDAPDPNLEEINDPRFFSQVEKSFYATFEAVTFMSALITGITSQNYHFIVISGSVEDFGILSKKSKIKQLSSNVWEKTWTVHWFVNIAIKYEATVPYKGLEVGAEFTLSDLKIGKEKFIRTKIIEK